MAATDAAAALPTAFDRAVLLDRFNAIGAASRLVTTVAAEHWTEADLVHSDHKDEQRTWKPNQPFDSF